MANEMALEVTNVKGGTVIKEGDGGVVLLSDGTNTLKLGVHHLNLPKLIESLEQLRAGIAKVRRDKGKDQESHTMVAKAVVRVSGDADPQQGVVLLKLHHPNGTSTDVAVPEAAANDLIEILRTSKEKLDRSPKRPAN